MTTIFDIAENQLYENRKNKIEELLKLRKQRKMNKKNIHDLFEKIFTEEQRKIFIDSGITYKVFVKPNFEGYIKMIYKNIVIANLELTNRCTDKDGLGYRWDDRQAFCMWKFSNLCIHLSETIKNIKEK